ncbi:MAG TPA: hypothetical protein PLX89_09395 [Verrucomicrobiota bacterium]|nr:hypothetical protein [Verrucomicrobiales bacterium]HRI13209.1 hypothetical protein [Verrucomicrobiota bacterium]
MKPHSDQARSSPSPARNRTSAYRSSAHDLIAESKQTRGEVILFVLLGAAVLLTFMEHAKVSFSFVQQLPELADAIANLVRNAV